MEDDASRQQPPAWKVREIEGRNRAIAEQRAWELAAIEMVHLQHEAERDRTAAREHQSWVNCRYCAGHDWVQEHQQRIGQTQRR